MSGIDLDSIGKIAEPVNTLILKISDAIGVLYEPKRIIKKAEAESKAEKIRAISDIEISDIKSRARSRVLFEETKNQENIESIIEKAIPQIQSNADFDKIDNDWIVNFFNKAKRFSNEDMKILWSKILAGQVNNTSNFSSKTLSIVSELSAWDALAFEALGKFCFSIGSPTIVIFDLENEIYSKNGIGLVGLMQLDSLGLIRYESGLTVFTKQYFPKTFSIRYYDKLINLEMEKENNNQLEVGRVLLTQAGQELIPLVEGKPDIDILKYSIGKWQEKGILIKDTNT